MHRKAAEKILDIVLSNGIRNNHRCQEDDSARGNSGVYTDDVAGGFQALQFRVFDFPINLCERFETAHRKHRMPERNDDGDDWNSGPKRVLEPPQTLIAEFEVPRNWRRRILRRP